MVARQIFRWPLVFLLVFSLNVVAYNGLPGFLDEDHAACDLYTDPHSHGVGDGHTHTHKDAGLPWNDPCNQIGVQVGIDPVTRGSLQRVVSTGEVPTYEDALDPMQYTQVDVLRIVGDEGFLHPQVLPDDAGMLIPGDGTPEDPFILQDLHITGELEIKNTDACFIIRNNFFSFEPTTTSHNFVWPGALSDNTPLNDEYRVHNIPTVQAARLELNFNGHCVQVVDNHIEDLRINQNVERTGYATGGYIENNVIQVVPQMRHFDGIFQGNDVCGLGPLRDDLALAPLLEEGGRVVVPRYGVCMNVDGFNQGIIQENHIDGSVVLDFHGHHHSAGWFAPQSHYHGQDFWLQGQEHHNHQQRFHSVHFRDNTVEDTHGFGVLYEDTGHDADDQSARSEYTGGALGLPHIHRTWVELAGNEITGALKVWVFNADADLHVARNDGWLDIRDNTITLRPGDATGLAPTFTQAVAQLLHRRDDVGPALDRPAGLDIIAAKEADIEVDGNEVRIVAPTVYALANDQDVPYAFPTGALPVREFQCTLVTIPLAPDRPEPPTPPAVHIGARECAEAAAGSLRTSGWVQGRPHGLHEHFGIRVLGASDAELSVQDNTVYGGDCAIRLQDLHRVGWQLRDNRFHGSQGAICLDGLDESPGTMHGNQWYREHGSELHWI